MDSSILFPAEIVNPRLIKVAYTRLNFVERRVIPHVENFSQIFFAEAAEARSGAPALGRRLGSRKVVGERVRSAESRWRPTGIYGRFMAKSHPKSPPTRRRITVDVAQTHFRARLRGPSGVPTTMGLQWASGQPATTSIRVASLLESLGMIPVAKTTCHEYSHGIMGQHAHSQCGVTKLHRRRATPPNYPIAF